MASLRYGNEEWRRHGRLCYTPLHGVIVVGGRCRIIDDYIAIIWRQEEYEKVRRRG